MAFSKADQFPAHLVSQSFWSRNLSHPARIIILLHLIEKGKAPFRTLKKQIALADSTVSRHIKYLLTSELIVVDQKFPYGVYDLNAIYYNDLLRELRKVQVRFIPKRKTRIP